LVKKIIDAQKDDEEWKFGKGMDKDEWKMAKFNRWDYGDHDTPIAGHPGQWRTLKLVQRSFWWPGMAVYIGKYVKGCDLCQRTKTFPEKP